MQDSCTPLYPSYVDKSIATGRLFVQTSLKTPLSFDHNLELCLLQLSNTIANTNQTKTKHRNTAGWPTRNRLV